MRISVTQPTKVVWKTPQALAASKLENSRSRSGICHFIIYVIYVIYVIYMSYIDFIKML